MVEGIYIDRIQMIDIPYEPLLFDLFYGGKAAGEESEDDLQGRMKAEIPPVTEETPAFRNIHISNVTCKGAGRAMFFNGLPEMPIDNVTISDVTISDAKQGIVISQARNVTLENVHIGTPGEAMQIKNAQDIRVDGQTYQNPGPKAMPVKM